MRADSQQNVTQLLRAWIQGNKILAKISLLTAKSDLLDQQGLAAVEDTPDFVPAIIGDKKRAVGQLKNPNRSTPYLLLLRV